MARHYSILLPTIFSLLGLIILCSLGMWQLQRLEWKEELLAQLDTEYAKEASDIMIDPTDIDQDNYDYKRGSLRGNFDFEKQILVGPRTYNNLPGKHVYTPFVLADGSVILVNRGWVPNEWRSENELPEARKAAQKGMVTGLLRRVWKRNPFTPPNNPAKDEWYYPDPDEIATAKNIPNMHKVIFSLEAAETEGNYPIAQGARPDIPNNHLQYAIFWFSMGFILVVIYALRFLKKDKS